MKVAVILPAAGHGTRMGKAATGIHTSERKQFMRLDGIPILALTVRKFVAVQGVEEILVAVPDGTQDAVREMLAQSAPFPRLRVIGGGPNRQDSVGACLDAVSADCEIVAVHDAVRPFVPVELIEKSIAEAVTRQAVILGMPAEETVKQVSREVVQATLSRERIMLVQTPQVFRTDLLRLAFAKARRDGFVGTDEASLIEHLNEDVYVMRGSERNIKITRPHHLALAQFYYQEENREAAADH